MMEITFKIIKLKATILISAT